MRWRITLSKRLRAHGYRQLQCDVCMFTNSNQAHEVVAFPFRHVGDILFTGTDEELLINEKVLRTYRAGDMEKLAYQSPIISDGILLGRPDLHSWNILLSQSHYDKELQKSDAAQFAQQGKIPNAQKLRTALRQVLGALIWLHQSRTDIGYDITKIATDSVAAFAEVGTALETLMIYNRTVRFANDYGRKILYSSFSHQQKSFGNIWRRLRTMRLIIFPAAGFGPLDDSRSIEGSCAVLVDVISRDGLISCRGTLLCHRCAKIQRVCKSSLAAE